MPLTFFETMSGELYDADGRAHHVAMDLRCESSRARSFLTDGRARITGTIRALPWVDGAAVVGTLVARPVIGRFMSYDVGFTDEEGRGWRLRGRKDVRLLTRPQYSLTHLAATLEREGHEVARGTMQFFANDYPRFLRSFKPWASFTPVLPDGQGPPAGGLRLRQRATLLAFAEAIIVADGKVPEASEETLATTEVYVSHLTPMLQTGFRVGLRALDAAARARHAKRFADLTLEQRRALVDRAGEGRLAALRSVVNGLAAPVKVSHFGRRDYLDALGAPDYANADREPTPGWMANVATPDEIPAADRVECDVVVVGTGAGGAAVAARLVEKGLGVVMVEEGRYVRRTEFAGNPVLRLMKYWRDGGLNVALGNSTIAVPTGRLVGGTTAINSGTAFRTPDSVLEEWLAQGFPSDFEPGSFKPYLDDVEAELQIGPTEDRYLGRVARIIAKGAEEVGGRHGPLPRNAPGCDGQGLCVFGCPTDAKRSANVSWVPRALKSGAQLFTGMSVTRILMSGRKAVGVLAEGQDGNGAPRQLEIRARTVVLATGTLVTPILLRRNGVDLPWLGRNLSIHPAFSAIAMMPDVDGTPWKAVPQGYHVTGIGDELVSFEGGAAAPPFGSGALPFHGAELSRWMNNWDRVEQFALMVRDTGVGSLRQGPGGRTLIRYDVTPRVLEAFKSGCVGLAEMFLRGGAQEVVLPIAGVPPVRTVRDARAIATADLKPNRFTAMGFHPLGTARMGADSRTAVVDFENRVFGTSGLYVADGSVIPSSLGVNPQVTIMAFALRAADAIAADLAG